MTAELAVAHQDGHLLLTLDRPQRGNALSASLVEALHAALDQAERDRARLVVLRGAGRHFCTGFDLTDLDSTDDAALVFRFLNIELLLARLWSAPFTSVAIAQGRVVGAGADLFAACTRRLAVAGASFRFPGASFGIVLGTRRLACLVGADAAHDMVAEGASLDASEACARGLATGVIEDAAIEAVIASELSTPPRLDWDTGRAIRLAIRDEGGALDRDLAALARSAARPGLAGRVRAYRDASAGAAAARMAMSRA